MQPGSHVARAGSAQLVLSLRLCLRAQSDCFVVVEARLNLDRYVCIRVCVCGCFFYVCVCVCVAVTKFACELPLLLLVSAAALGLASGRVRFAVCVKNVISTLS